MKNEISKTLWSNSTRDRFFVIPEKEALPRGEFEIQTVTGRKQKVDSSALTPFELSKEEATKWLTMQLKQVVHQGKDALLGFFGRLRASTQTSASHACTENPGRMTAKESDSQKPGPGMRLFSALAGEPGETLHQDPEAVGRATRKILTDLEEFFESSTSLDPARLEHAHKTAREVRAKLLHVGFQIGEEFNDIPDALHRLYDSPVEPEILNANAESLKELANVIEETSAMIVENLRTQEERLRRKLAENKA